MSFEAASVSLPDSCHHWMGNILSHLTAGVGAFLLRLRATMHMLYSEGCCLIWLGGLQATIPIRKGSTSLLQSQVYET